MFIDAYLAGLNTQLLTELRWRNIPVATGCTPIRRFWDRADTASGARVDDIAGVAVVAVGRARSATPPTSPRRHRPRACDRRARPAAAALPDHDRLPASRLSTGPPVTDFDADPDDDAARILPGFHGRLATDVAFFGFPAVRRDGAGRLLAGLRGAAGRIPLREQHRHRRRPLGTTGRLGHARPAGTGTHPRRCAHSRRRLMADLGVLLPVRIETRFKDGDLWLRVVPDEPWFVRDDPRISTDELLALRRYLAASRAPGPDGIPAAWRHLAAQVGAPRAVYLHRTFVTTAADGTLSVRPPGAHEQRTEPGAPEDLRLPHGAGRLGSLTATGLQQVLTPYRGPQRAAGRLRRSRATPATGAGGRTGTRRSRWASRGSSRPRA